MYQARSNAGEESQFLKTNRRRFLALSSGIAVSSRAQVITPERRGVAQRVLVVGAGLAGLCSAYELSRQGHDVLLFEVQTSPVAA
jgi:heterodisulfide reductase subunit A-like polyferredoxin